MNDSLFGDPPFDFEVSPTSVRRKNKQNWSPLVAILLVLACVLLAAILLIEANRQSPSPSSKTILTTGAITKQEWKAKAYKIEQSHRGDKYNPIREKELYKAFGKPFKVQTVGDRRYWYWRCSDGIIQLVLVAVDDPNDDRCGITAINDY